MAKSDAVQRMVAEIATYQERQELTDQQVADELGVPRSTWTAARLGTFTPGLKFAQQVAKSARFRDVALKVFAQ